jgi:signal transduction histidine kinase
LNLIHQLRPGWKGVGCFQPRAEITLLAAVYFLVGKLGLMLDVPAASSVWPPAGIALAAPLVFGYRVWPGVFLGACMLGITTGSSAVSLFSVAAGETIEGVAGAWLINRFARGARFYEHPQNVVKFAVLGGLLSPLLCPPFGLGNLSWRGMLFWTHPPSDLLAWWLGEMLSVLVLTPLIVVGRSNPRIRWNGARALEFGGMILLLVLVSSALFTKLSPEQARKYLAPYLCLPFPLWAAFRFGPRGTAVATCVQGAVALWGTLHGYGLFVDTASEKSLISYQGFTAFNSVMGLVVAAVVSQRRQAQAALGEALVQLEHRVAESTAANRELEAEVLQRKRAESALAGVLSRLIDAEETERRRVSRELHDQMGQNLSALKLGLKLAGQGVAGGSQARVQLARLVGLTDQMMRDVHRLAWDLRPPMLDDFGLESALRRYTEEWSLHGGVALDFHHYSDSELRLPGNLETTLYRVTQEALNNILKHAHASRVSVILERRGKGLSLIIEDDGVGFDAEAEAPFSDPRPGGLGLLGMRERVLLAGGAISIESSPGTGTAVYVRFELDPAGGNTASDYEEDTHRIGGGSQRCA